ncbi:RNA-binding protein 45-like [Galleria mellonella]|uniref:RNA-binding protein 45-like n=1 Tax=Galleria mellonella TaxID=7137 RepID=A0A6J1X8S7_GALME|nr:RNA-binding protein 45-like [Galleria mellonella]XP_031769684.2 RNA-binding protein 45-like [Galleria mellonella]
MTSMNANFWNQNMKNDERKDDKPPYSRIFVVCGKQLQEEDLKAPFEVFGDIEDLYIPRDRNSGESKGVAYIKYNKTSSAAAAIQELHMKNIKNSQKPIKVMVAASKNDVHSNNEEKYKRLFIKVHKEASESEIREHFSNFGKVDSVHLQRDRLTDMCKGFAYVNYTNFLEAAKAFENCDRKYRPVFATPKEELKRSRISLDGAGVNFGDSPQLNNFNSNRDSSIDHYNQVRDGLQKDTLSLIKAQPHHYDTVCVTCSPQVSQKHIEKLFNIIPGMNKCQYTTDTYNGICKSIITYDSEKAAAYAVERLNNFEFPSGEIVSVKPDDNPLNKAASTLTNIVNSFRNSIDAGNNGKELLQLADAIAQASCLIKAATSGKVETKTDKQDCLCSVPLPPPQPIVNNNSRVAQRCFIVCKPCPPPATVLKDAFCRFGDLIDVSTFPNKTFGFAKYASIRSAQEAIKTLNGAVLSGIKLKVMEADERPTKSDDYKMIVEEQNDNFADYEKEKRKRMKLNDRDTDE